MEGLQPLLGQMLAPLGVTFTLRWQGQPRLLPLDGIGVEQLLMNLIKNGAESAARTDGPAAQRAEPGRVELLVCFEAALLILEIRDNGPGLRLPEAQLQQAFHSDKDDGMGLGLAICRDVVECHRGQLALSNLSPHGCLARVTLPAPQQRLEAASHPNPRS
ncbi:Sensor histidine kinase TodS [compost metagenome]